MSAAHSPWAIALGQAVGMVRALKNISLREHARQLGLSPATLSRIERGFGCDLAQLVKIHEKTGVAYDVLLGEKRS